jgi:serine/threonine-protein kinase PknG
VAVALESGGQAAEAARWYDIVACTDPSVTGASFGLARCRLALGDRAGAIAAYARVPDSSSGYLDAQTARIRLLSAGGGANPSPDELLDAASQLGGLPVDEHTRAQLTACLLGAALRLTRDGRSVGDERARLLGRRLTERDLRVGLESAYRALARHATTRAERIRLVDEANRTRPRTWI